MVNFRNKTVLVISPHPDDEIIGCGGTLLKNRAMFKQLIIVYICADEPRKREIVEVEKRLAVDKHYFLGGDDGFISLDSKSICLQLIDILIIERPHIVFLPFRNDAHPDHIATNQIGWDAIEKARYWKEPQWHIDIVLEYEVWSFINDIGYIEDITDQEENKVELIRLYKSQLGFNYSTFIEYKSGYRGLMHNRAGFAEVFRVREY